MRALIVAALVTLAAVPLVRALAPTLGLMDHPGSRSSHREPRPRTGGLAILAGWGAAAVSCGVAAAPRLDLRAWGAGLALLVLVGVLDDRFRLSALLRLLSHLAAAATVTWATGGLERLPLPSPLDVPLGGLAPAFTVVWVAAIVNFFNFMDGIDGLAGSQGLVTGATLGLAFASRDPLPSALAAALAGACVSFLYSNWHPASIFLGDTGSTVLGYCFASMPLLIAPDRRPGAAVLVTSSLFLFLSDATTCLLARLWARRPLHQAHRGHLYQRWVDAGVGQAKVAARLALGALLTSVVALVGWLQASPGLQWTALALGAGLFLLEWRLVLSAEGSAFRGR